MRRKLCFVEKVETSVTVNSLYHLNKQVKKTKEDQSLYSKALHFIYIRFKCCFQNYDDHKTDVLMRNNI